MRIRAAVLAFVLAEGFRAFYDLVPPMMG